MTPPVTLYALCKHTPSLLVKEYTFGTLEKLTAKAEKGDLIYKLGPMVQRKSVEALLAVIELLYKANCYITV